MPSQVMKLKSDKGAAEIEADGSLIDIQLPLTLKGWSLAEMTAGFGGRTVVVRSADGAYFIGEITDVDEEKYILTVELS